MQTPLPITDDEAADLLGQFDTADEPRRKIIGGLLLDYQDQQKAAQYQAKSDFFEGVYTDPVKRQEFFETPSMKVAADNSIAPDATRYRATNQAYLAHVGGVQPQDIDSSYEIQRDQKAKDWFGKPSMTDEEFFNSVSDKQKQIVDIRKAIEEVPGDVIAARFDDMATGQVSSTAKVLSMWRARFPDIHPAEGDEQRMMGAASDISQNVESVLQKYGQQTKAVSDGLQKLVSGNSDIGELGKLAESLVDIPAEDRQKIYQIGGIYARKTSTKRNDPTQFLENVAEFTERAISAPVIGLAGVEEDRQAEGDPKKLLELQIRRELLDAANRTIDPITPVATGWLGIAEQVGYSTAQSAPYLALASIPVVGAPLTMAAYAGTEYDRIRLEYPDVSLNAARGMALVSGAAQAAFDKLQVENIAGRLPATKKVLEAFSRPTTSLAKRVLVGSGLNFAEQYVQEELQNLTPLVVDEVAHALGADMPNRDWNKEFSDFKDTSAQTFFALLPFWMIGTGAIHLSELKRGRQFAGNVDYLQSAGIDLPAAKEIAAESDPDKQDKLLQNAFDAMTPEAKAKVIAKSQAAISSAEALQSSQGEPTVEVVTKEDGSHQSVVRDSKGTEIYRTDDDLAAAMAVADEREANAGSQQKLVVQLVNYFQNLNESRGVDAKFEVGGKSKTGQEFIDSLPDEDKPEAIDQLRERLRIEAKINPDLDPEGSLSSFVIDGQSEAQFKEGIFTAVNRIAKGADPMVVVQEHVETEIKRALAERRVTIDWLRSQVQSYEHASGESLLTDSDQSVIEGVSTLAQSYFSGKLRDPQLPTGLRAYFRQMVQVFKSVFVRAAKLKKAIRDGKVSKDFETFLAHSIGLSDEAQIAHVRDMELGNTFSIRPNEKVNADITHSIKTKEYRAKLDEALAKLDTDPELRRDMIQRAREDVRRILAGAKELLSPKEVDPTDTLDHIEQDRAAKLADLYAEEKEALTENLLDNRDDAGKPINRKATSEKQKAIKKEYAAKREDVETAAKTESDRVTRESEAYNKLAAEKHDKKSVRAGTIQSIGVLESIVRKLPSEARGRIGGFAELSKKTTDQERVKYLVGRIEKVGEEMERYLKEDALARIKKILKNSRPKKNDSGVLKSNLGPEAQKISDKVYAASLLDAKATAERLSAIEGLMESDDLTPEKATDLMEEWAIVNSFGDLSNRNADTLTASHDWLSTTLKAGRSKWRITEEARHQKNAEHAKIIVDGLGGATDRGLALKSKGERFLDLVKSFDISHQSFLQILDLIMPESAREISHSWQKQLRIADNKTIDTLREAGKKLEDVVKNTLGTSSWIKIGQAIKNFKETKDNIVQKISGRTYATEKIPIDLAEKIVRGEIDAGKLTPEDVEALRGELAARREKMAERDLDAAMGGNDNARIAEDLKDVSIERIDNPGTLEFIPMSSEEAVQYLLAWNQKDVRAKMERLGWSERSIKQMESMTSDDVSQNIMAHLRDEYAASHGISNPVYERIFGMELPSNNNYAPTRYHNSKDSPDIGPHGGANESKSGIPGYAKSRVSHSARMRQMGALTVYWQHVSQQTHWTNYAEVTREMRAVLQSPKVRESIEQAYGNSVVQQIDRWLDAIAVQGGAKSTELLVDQRFVNALISGKAISSLGMNLKSILMQADSSIRFVLSMPTRNAIRALSNPIKFISAVKDVWESDTIQRRIENGASPDARFLIEQGRVRPSVLLKAAVTSMLPLQYFDAGMTSISAAIVFKSAYDEALSSGANPTLAKEMAADAMDDAVYRYSQPTGLANRSLREVGSGTVQRLMMLFMADPRLKTAVMSEAIRGLATGKGDKSQHIRRILAIEAMAMLSQILSNVYRDTFSDEDDDEIWTAGGFVRAAFLAPLQGYFLVGAAADVAIASAINSVGKVAKARGIDTKGLISKKDTQVFSQTENPLTASFYQGGRAMSDIDNIYDPEHPEEMLSEWNSLARSAAIFGPASAVPSVVINAVKPLLGAYRNTQKDDNN